MAEPVEKVATPVAEFAAREDFPECTRGQLVDIGGYVGTVADIVGNSMKVRNPEGVTRSFNFHALKRLYGPRIEIAPMPEAPPPAPQEKEAPTPAPEPDEIQELNFDRDPKPINGFIVQPNFPRSVLGEFLDIGGYTGIVVSIISDSLKVRSKEGTSRKYNANVLRKIYGPVNPPR